MIICEYISLICNAITTRYRFDLPTSVSYSNYQCTSRYSSIYYLLYINGLYVLCAHRTINTQIVVAAALVFVVVGPLPNELRCAASRCPIKQVSCCIFTWRQVHCTAPTLPPSAHPHAWHRN